MREPAFWWREAGLAAGLLAPAAACYGAVAAQRMAQAGARAGVPVLCAGNFTLGGAGKTPTALWLAKMLKDAGERPLCLSRGYGGNSAGPKLVTDTDSAEQVGDEALLLARIAPTIIARDRVAGAEAAAQAGVSVVVMDDGLQNPSLAKDFTLAVVDGRRGIGNGRVFPAGPLRAPLATQLARSDVLLVIGDGNPGIKTDLPVFHGRLVPDAAAVTALKTRKVLAFAGIGDPDKFFATVQAAGIAVAQHTPFPDHHRFTAEEAAGLIMQAEYGGLALLTTEKDRARMTGDPVLAALAAKAHVLPVTLAVDEEEKLRTLVLAKLRR
ncbi:MAG TPA: tetraacyldisaccharide 4'-kinase [Pseudolabrys sp.]|jgi:tetraacyldisaccharide 4'-kinase